MKLVKELIKAKGLTERRVAHEIGVGHHSFSKMITRAPWRTSDGEIRFRECRHIREKFAAWLGYPYELIWGCGADHFLKKLIAEEIERQIEEEREQRLQALAIL